VHSTLLLNLLAEQSIGIIPGIDPEEANPYISHVICTGMGQARNVVFVQSTDALIAVDGSYGTLSEIAIALKQRIPVVALESRPNAQLDGDELFARAEGPADAVSRALAYAKERRSGRGG